MCTLYQNKKKNISSLTMMFIFLVYVLVLVNAQQEDYVETSEPTYLTISIDKLDTSNSLESDESAEYEINSEDKEKTEKDIEIESKVLSNEEEMELNDNLIINEASKMDFEEELVSESESIAQDYVFISLDKLVNDSKSDEVRENLTSVEITKADKILLELNENQLNLISLSEENQTNFSDPEIPLNLELVSPSYEEVLKNSNLILTYYIKNGSSQDYSCNLTLSNSNGLILSRSFSSNSEELVNESFYLNVTGRYFWQVNCVDSISQAVRDAQFYLAGAVKVNAIIQPSSQISMLPFNYLFNVSSGWNGQLNCSFNLVHPNLTIQRENFLTEDALITRSIYGYNGGYSWNFSCFSAEDSNNFSIVNATFNSIVNLTPVISFSSNRNEIYSGESISFSIQVSSPYPLTQNLSYRLVFGDNSVDEWYSSEASSISRSRQHTYASLGNYSAKLFSYHMGSVSNTVNLSIKVVNDEDEDAPKINLISPFDGQEFNSDVVQLSFKVSDENSVSNCTLSIYPYLTYSASISILNNTPKFTQTFYNPSKDSVLSVSARNLFAQDYAWGVVCTDQNNYRSREQLNDFSISFLYENISSLTVSGESVLNSINQDYTYKQDVEILLDRANNFLEKATSLSQDEIEALEDLGLIESVKFQKKKIMQIKTDLQGGETFILNQEQRAKRVSEIRKELDELEKQVPSSLIVVAKKNFQKQSIDSDLAKLIERYSKAQGLSYSASQIKELAQKNKQAQHGVFVSVSIKHVELSYGLEKKEQITLIKKIISSKDNASEIFFEYLTEDETFNYSVNMPEFVNAEISGSLYSFEKSKLPSDTLVYRIDGFVSLATLEKSDIIAFVDELGDSNFNFLTGFASFEGGLNNLESLWKWIILGIVILVVLILILAPVREQWRVNRWKQKSKVFAQALDLAKECAAQIKQHRLEEAKETYTKVREIYPMLATPLKNYLYPRLKKLQLQIDKVDASRLIKACLAAIEERNVTEAFTLYNHLKIIYSRLPRDYQKIVYERIAPVLGNENFSGSEKR